MSHFCPSHPRYSAKREPNSLCGRCWVLYFYRCPEERVSQTEQDRPENSFSHGLNKGFQK